MFAVRHRRTFVCAHARARTCVRVCARVFLVNKNGREWEDWDGDAARSRTCVEQVFKPPSITYAMLRFPRISSVRATNDFLCPEAPRMFDVDFTFLRHVRHFPCCKKRFLVEHNCPKFESMAFVITVTVNCLISKIKFCTSFNKIRYLLSIKISAEINVFVLRKERKLKN